MKHRLLLVDDDDLHLEVSQEFLIAKGFDVDTAKSGDEAIARVSENPHLYSLVTVDYRMQGKDGAATVEALTKINPDLYILVLSGDESREAIMRSTRSGARGFIDKAESKETFLSEITKWCTKFEQTNMTIQTHRDVSANEALIAQLGMVGRSQAMAAVSELVTKLKDRVGPVLILGESGTGKELIARALHNPERGLFRAVNCAAFGSNPQLMASTLFGHVKGSFTGATHDKKGVLEEVNGGTVFLDEIYALPIASQLELLRVLQEKAITPVGSTREIKVDFRLVAAAKPDLLDAVKNNRFTLDLFYRIGRSIIALPPLRERAEDIEPLVHHFASRWSKENGEEKTFLVRTMPYLESYSWPGNIRELENLVFSLLDLSSESKIAPHHLDPKFFQKTLAPTTATNLLSLKQRLDDVERDHLVSVLSISKTLREASRRMQVSLTTVLRLIKKHNLQPLQHLGVNDLRQSAKELLTPKKPTT